MPVDALIENAALRAALKAALNVESETADGRWLIYGPVDPREVVAAILSVCASPSPT